jgi:hypothetical protein
MLQNMYKAIVFLIPQKCATIFARLLQKKSRKLKKKTRSQQKNEWEVPRNIDASGLIWWCSRKRIIFLALLIFKLISALILLPHL